MDSIVLYLIQSSEVSPNTYAWHGVLPYRTSMPGVQGLSGGLFSFAHEVPRPSVKGSGDQPMRIPSSWNVLRCSNDDYVIMSSSIITN